MASIALYFKFCVALNLPSYRDEIFATAQITTADFRTLSIDRWRKFPETIEVKNTVPGK